MILHNLKPNPSLFQILSFIQSSFQSDFTYCVKFADHCNCQLHTYERNSSCFLFSFWSLVNVFSKYICLKVLFYWRRCIHLRNWTERARAEATQTWALFYFGEVVEIISKSLVGFWCIWRAGQSLHISRIHWKGDMLNLARF